MKKLWMEDAVKMQEVEQIMITRKNSEKEESSGFEA